MTDILGVHGHREYAVISSLLADPSLIPVVAAELGPNDFFRHEALTPGKPITITVKPADYKAGALRQVVFDAIVNRGAHSLAALEVCLTSHNNQTGKPVNAALVAAVLPKLRRDVVHPQFGELVAALVSDKAKWRAFFEKPDCDCSDDCPAECACECHGGAEVEPVEPQTGPFQTVSMASLAGRQDAPSYFVEGLVGTEGAAAWGAPPKGRKTGFAIDLGVALTTGRPFLNHFPVIEQCNYFLASGEDSRQSLAERFRRVCAAKSVDPAAVRGFTLTTELPPLNSDKAIAAFARRVQDSGARVAGLDPLYRALTGDGKTLNNEGKQLADITDAVAAAGAKLLVCHHLKKSTAAGRAGLASFTGAGVEAWCREWLLIEPVSTYKAATGSQRLKLSAGGSNGHSGEWNVRIAEGNLADSQGRKWQVEVTPAGQSADSDARAAKQLDSDAATVLAAMKSLGVGETLTAIRKASGLNSDRLKPALAELRRRGQIDRIRIAKGPRKYAGYSVAAAS